MCDFIRQKIVNDKLIIIMQKDQWDAFELEYELTNVAQNTSKLCVHLGHTFRKDVIFIRVGTITNYSFKKASTQYNKHICNLYRLIFQNRYDKMIKNITTRKDFKEATIKLIL